MDKHVCPLCGRNQVLFWNTWLCPQCDSFVLHELVNDKEMMEELNNKK
jgi:ribosomal protein L37AE/L43A